MKTIFNVRTFFLFALALAVRGAYLAYNFSWNLPPVWLDVARMSLVAAETHFGLSPSFSDFTPDAAIGLLKSDDRGIAFLHGILIYFFGSSSLLSIQIWNVVLDSSMVFPMIYLGSSIKNAKFGEFVGLAYALFLPSIFVSIQTSWHAALSAGSICLLAQAVYLMRNSQTSARKFALHAALAFALTFIVAQFRSTIIFYPIFVAIFSIIFIRKKAKLLSACMISGGILALVGSSLVNYQISGVFVPTRSNTGHCFWIGVGEFENPYGLTETDSSAGSFYERNTGLKLNYFDTQAFAQYESWMKKEAVSFIASHPILYISMVARRALKVIFPNFRIQRVADEESYARFGEKNRVERLAITKSKRLFTAEGIKTLWKIDAAFFFELMIRTIFFIFLPFGALATLGRVWGNPETSIFASALLYSLATISLLRGPAMNHYSAWAASLPLVLLGLLEIYQWLATKWKARLA